MSFSLRAAAGKAQLLILTLCFAALPASLSAFSVSKDKFQLVRPAEQLIGWHLPFMKGE